MKSRAESGQGCVSYVSCCGASEHSSGAAPGLSHAAGPLSIPRPDTCARWPWLHVLISADPGCFNNFPVLFHSTVMDPPTGGQPLLFDRAVILSGHGLHHLAAFAPMPRHQGAKSQPSRARPTLTVRSDAGQDQGDGVCSVRSTERHKSYDHDAVGRDRRAQLKGQLQRGSISWKWLVQHFSSKPHHMNVSWHIHVMNHGMIHHMNHAMIHSCDENVRR